MGTGSDHDDRCLSPFLVPFRFAASINACGVCVCVPQLPPPFRLPSAPEAEAFPPKPAPFAANPCKSLQNPASCIAPQETPRLRESAKESTVESTERCGFGYDNRCRIAATPPTSRRRARLATRLDFRPRTRHGRTAVRGGGNLVTIGARRRRPQSLARLVPIACRPTCSTSESVGLVQSLLDCGQATLTGDASPAVDTDAIPPVNAALGRRSDCDRNSIPGMLKPDCDGTMRGHRQTMTAVRSILETHCPNQHRGITHACAFQASW